MSQESSNAVCWCVTCFCPTARLYRFVDFNEYPRKILQYNSDCAF